MKGDKVRFPGAKRPWNYRLPEFDPEQKVMPVETPKLKAEREMCLHCKLPTCPHYLCPISTKDKSTSGRKPGMPRKIPPEEFLDWAWGPLSNTAWGRKCGVAPCTVRRWRKDYAEEIENRRKRKHAPDGK